MATGYATVMHGWSLAWGGIRLGVDQPSYLTVGGLLPHTHTPLQTELFKSTIVVRRRLGIWGVFTWLYVAQAPPRGV